MHNKFIRFDQGITEFENVYGDIHTYIEKYIVYEIVSSKITGHDLKYIGFSPAFKDVI